MSIVTVPCTPYADQKPGTSGLRKQTRHFQQPNYLETFVQAIFQVKPPEGALVVGGDGRFFNAEAIQSIIRLAIANGCKHLIIGRDGLLSTPAASHLVRSRKAGGAIILSASHNPAGPDGDFGIKFNGPNGAPAGEDVTEAFFEASKALTSYQTIDSPPCDLSALGSRTVGGATVEIIDPAADYADLMEQLFDFDQIRGLLSSGRFHLLFDAMSAVTGPYGREILVNRLGAPEDCLLRAQPLTDFGHAHPDPTPANAKELVRRLAAQGGPDFGAASDGDGDRHMVLAPGFHVNPSDSLAILTANAELVPGYRGRMSGVARSMPTSRAVDVVAKALNLPCYETPTGWKFFGSLLDAGAITLCGEESAGAGSDHIREKDGVWAILFWLNLVAARGQSVREIVEDHWRRFGRHACVRLDYDGLPAAAAQELMAALTRSLGDLKGQSFGDQTIEGADMFDYVDPINGATAKDQGVRLFTASGGRVVYRLSGTGTSGATLRVYLEQYTQEAARLSDPAADLVAPLEALAKEAAMIEKLTGRSEPSARV